MKCNCTVKNQLFTSSISPTFVAEQAHVHQHSLHFTLYTHNAGDLGYLILKNVSLHNSYPLEKKITWLSAPCNSAFILH